MKRATSGHPDPEREATEAGPRDPSSFVDVYHEFQPRILRYLTRLVGQGEAEDLTQDVFAKVSEALPRFRGASKLSTWVYRIATNTALDRLRSPSSRRAGRVPVEVTTPETERASTIVEDLARREANECIRRYLDRLPATYRSVVLLSEHEGFTNREIAEALGISLDTVKIRLHRARSRLRKELAGGCDLYRDDRNELACAPRVYLSATGLRL